VIVRDGKLVEGMVTEEDLARFSETADTIDDR
jgi:hypothetical protein